MIGRADRGLQGKTVDIWYIITRGSNEPMYFNESIMKRSTMIQEVLSKDYTELDNIADDLYQELNR